MERELIDDKYARNYTDQEFAKAIAVLWNMDDYQMHRKIISRKKYIFDISGDIRSPLQLNTHKKSPICREWLDSLLDVYNGEKSHI